MNLTHWIAGLASAAITMAMGQTPKEAPAMDRQMVYIDDVKAPASIAAGKSLDVSVTGNLPTPQWELTTVDVTKSNRTVSIVLWSRLKHDGMSIQVLEPFTKVVKVDGLTAGTWTIDVKGHGDTSASTKVLVK